jgi:Clp amino terminal domain, pathogenicity island component
VREAVVLARAHAHGLGQDGLGTEHLLLGLLGVKEGLAAWVLGSFNGAAQPVRDQVLQMAGAASRRARLKTSR